MFVMNKTFQGGKGGHKLVWLQQGNFPSRIVSRFLLENPTVATVDGRLDSCAIDDVENKLLLGHANVSTRTMSRMSLLLKVPTECG